MNGRKRRNRIGRCQIRKRYLTATTDHHAKSYPNEEVSTYESAVQDSRFIYKMHQTSRHLQVMKASSAVHSKKLKIDSTNRHTQGCMSLTLFSTVLVMLVISSDQHVATMTADPPKPSLENGPKLCRHSSNLQDPLK